MFNRDPQSIALMARHIEAYVDKRRVKEFDDLLDDESLDSEKRSEIEKQKAAYLNTLEHKQADTFLDSQSRKLKVPRAHTRTIIDSVGKRLYLTDNMLPIDLPEIQQRLSHIGEEETGEESYIEDKVRAMKNLLGSSKNTEAQQHYAGLEKMAEHIANAHREFLFAQQNLEIVRRYGDEHGWESVKWDSVLGNIVKRLVSSWAHLTRISNNKEQKGKIQRMEEWRDVETKNTAGWKPVVTVLDDLLADAYEVRGEGEKAIAEAKELVEKLGLDPKIQNALFIPNDTRTLEISGNSQIELLTNTLRDISRDMGISIPDIIAQEGLDSAVKIALSEAQDAVTSADENRAQVALEKLLEQLGE